jgi:hypothetical protein
MAVGKIEAPYRNDCVELYIIYRTQSITRIRKTGHCPVFLNDGLYKCSL